LNEVSCICGESIVFLDPEVEVKTCPNCGMKVYQYESGRSFEPPGLVLKKKRSSQSYWMTGFLLAVALAVAIVAGLSFFRRRALVQAGEYVERAETAARRGDYHIAAQAYEQALVKYRAWGAESELVCRLESALESVSDRIEAREREAAAVAVSNEGPLGISLEELARQAYSSGRAEWQRTFARRHAGRWVILQGPVRKLAPTAPAGASDLTIPYRAFSPSGEALEIAFDGPFLERYRLEEGRRCIVKAVLSEPRLARESAAAVGRWLLMADAEESELVTDTSQLEALGWQPDEDLRNIVARQRSLSPAY